MNTATLSFKALPLAERLQLVEDIWDTIAEETSFRLQVSPEDSLEFKRRLSEHRENPSSSIAWEQVRSALFNQSAQ